MLIYQEFSISVAEERKRRRTVAINKAQSLNRRIQLFIEDLSKSGYTSDPKFINTIKEELFKNI